MSRVALHCDTKFARETLFLKHLPGPALPIKRSKKQPRSQKAPPQTILRGQRPLKMRGLKWGGLGRSKLRGLCPLTLEPPKMVQKLCLQPKMVQKLVQKPVQIAPCFCTIFVQKPKFLHHNLHHVWCKRGCFLHQVFAPLWCPRKDIHVYTTPLNQSIA